jgi:hypothetical protein
MQPWTVEWSRAMQVLQQRRALGLKSKPGRPDGLVEYAEADVLVTRTLLQSPLYAGSPGRITTNLPKSEKDA